MALVDRLRRKEQSSPPARTEPAKAAPKPKQRAPEPADLGPEAAYQDLKSRSRHNALTVNGDDIVEIARRVDAVLPPS